MEPSADVERYLQQYAEANFCDGTNSSAARSTPASNSSSLRLSCPLNSSVFDPTPTAPEACEPPPLNENACDGGQYVLQGKRSEPTTIQERSLISHAERERIIYSPENGCGNPSYKPECDSDNGVDLAELAKLLEHHKEHSVNCQGQEVVFFLGNTGAGKSLTINYLTGRRIVKMIDAEDECSERIEVDDPLDGCHVGHTADSTTRFLRSFADPHTDLVFCDTPGFEDTEGHLVDTANAVAISSTIRNCKSVRLVLLIEASAIGQMRGNNLKNLLLLIQRFINDAQNRLSSVLPLFTHCAEYTPKKIQSSLDKFLKSTHFHDAKPFVQHLINSLMIHGEALVLRPAGVDGERLLPQVRDLIKGIHPIVDIRSALNSPLSESAKTSLILACKGMTAQMERNFRNKRTVGALSDELDELKVLSEALDVKEVSDNYLHLCKILTEHIVEACSKGREAIKQARFVDAAHYMNTLDGYERLRDHYELVYPQLRAREYVTLLVELSQFIKSMELEIQHPGTPVEVLRSCLDHLASVSQLLSNYVDARQRHAYQTAVSVAESRFHDTAESAMMLIQNRHFASEKLGAQLCDLQQLPMLQAHIKTPFYYDNCIEAMRTSIGASFDSVMKCLSAPLDADAPGKLEMNMQTIMASQSVDPKHLPDAQTLAVQCLTHLDEVVNKQFASLDLALTQQQNGDAAACIVQLQRLDVRKDSAFRTRYQDKLRDILIRWENDVLSIRSLLEHPAFSQDLYPQVVNKMHAFSSALQHLCMFFESDRISEFSAEFQQWQARIAQLHTVVVEEGLRSLGQGPEAKEEPEKTIVSMSHAEHILNINLDFDVGMASNLKRFASGLVDHFVQSCSDCLARTKCVGSPESIEQAHARLVTLRSYKDHLKAAANAGQTFDALFKLSGDDELSQSLCTPRKTNHSDDTMSSSPSEAATVEKRTGRGKKRGDGRPGRGILNTIKCALSFSTAKHEAVSAEQDSEPSERSSGSTQTFAEAVTPDRKMPRPSKLAQLVQMLECCLEQSKSNLQERATELVGQAQCHLVSHDFSEVCSMLVCLQRLGCFEGLLEVVLLDRFKGVIEKTKQTLTSFSDAFDASLRLEQMENARQALDNVHAMTVLNEFLEVKDTYQRLNNTFHEKTGQFSDTVNKLLNCKSFLKLAKLTAGHKELLHSLPMASQELYVALQQLLEFFKDRYDLGWTTVQVMTSTKQLPQAKLNEISEVIKDFSDAHALFEVFSDNTQFTEWEEILVKTLEHKVEGIHQHAETCIRNLDLKGFDAAVNYLESLQVISLMAQRCGASIEALNTGILTRINELEQELISAFERLDHRGIDKIFNGLGRGLDLNTVGGIRVDQEYDALITILERELSLLCEQIKQSLAKYDIRNAHRNIESFRCLLVSEAVKKTQYNSDVLQRFCSDMDEIKAEILSPRLVTEDPEKISQYLEGFKEVDNRFYLRQRGSFLDKLKAQIRECGEQVASRDVRNLKGLEHRLRELKCYEIALRGQGCDCEIKGYRKELLEFLTETIEQVHSDIEIMVQRSRWEEIEKLKKFFSKALPILQDCDFAEEEVKREFIAKFEDLTAKIQEKGRNISSKWSLLESFDLTTSSCMNAHDLEQFLHELEKEGQLLEGRLAKGFAAQDMSKEKAIRELRNRFAFATKDVRRLWDEELFDHVKNIMANLDSLSVVDCLCKDARTALTDVQTFVSGHVSGIEKSAVEHFHHALHSKDKDTLLSRKSFQNASEDLERIKQLQKHFGAFKEICPQDREEGIVRMMMQATDRLADEFDKLATTGMPQIPNIVALVLKLWVIPSEVSNQKVKAHARAKIAHIFEQCREEGKKRKTEFNFTELASRLSTADPKGGEIVEDFNEIFKAFHTAKFREATARMTFDDSLEKMVELNKLNEVQANLLRVNYTKFQETFRSLLEKCYNPGQVLVMYKASTGSSTTPEVPDTLATIFAIWSLQISSSATREKDDIWATPHPVQVLSLLRLLGVDRPDRTGGSGSVDFIKSLLTTVGDLFRSKPTDSKQGRGHLIELRTGEGKSIVLGALATILALYGFEVDCVCYSKYLSTRDFNAFKAIFEIFGVQDRITYGTFTSLSKKLINMRCDVRSTTRKFLADDKPDLSTSAPSRAEKRILLIDEVDVFFSEDFYGNIYAASTNLVDENIEAVQQCIWRQRAQPQGSILNEIKRLPAYAALKEKFRNNFPLIERHINEMLKDVKRIDDKDHVYRVDSDGKIAYVTQDTTSNNIICGYKTLFAYFKEHELGTVSADNLKAALGLQIKCGNFSYAEIPKYYNQILGVTGTLQSLGDFEKKVIEHNYCIKDTTLTPSIYGDSKLTFREVSDVHCEMEEAQYNRKIKEEILAATKDDRAVIVFFEDEAKMKEWMKSGYASGIDHMSSVTSSTENIDHHVKQATRARSVTLFTAVHGRGLDFVCHDKNIDAKGGIHVVQTFLSGEYSEEIQIKGRTARQDKKGTYKLVLHIPALDRFSISAEEVEEARKTSKLYDLLHAKRNAWFARESEARNDEIKRAQDCHQRSLEYQDLLLEYRGAFHCAGVRKSKLPLDQRIRDSLLGFNDFRLGGSGGVCRMLCLSDATGSMTSLWDGAKKHIVTMLERIDELAGTGRVQLKWVAYRDYSEGSELIQCSEWTGEARTLKGFLDTVKCHGGGDFEEAVEEALAQANREDPLPTRVILIGDAPPHPEKAGEKLPHHNHVLTTDWARECDALAAKDIPVYTFRVAESRATAESFAKIARATSGEAKDLVSADDLLDVVCMQALEQLGGSELVDKYREKYLKFSFAS